MTVAKRFSWILVALTILILLPAVAQAGLTGKITGKIVDKKTGEGMPGVSVVLKGTKIGAMTKPDGSFIILNIPPKTYDVMVRLIGYKNVTIKDVVVLTDKTFRLGTIEMEETVLEEEEQVITAKRDEIRLGEVQNIRSVTSEEIKQMPVDNVDQILVTQVGVVNRNGEIHIRGGRAGEVSYIVDGVETRDPLGGQGATDVGINLTSNALEEVQVIKAGFDAEYGSVMTGVVRVATREGSVQLTSGRFEYWTDNFRAPELNTYSFNYDRVAFNLSGPEPLFSQRVLPALGLDFLEDKLAYFINLDVTKNTGYLDFNEYAPNLHQRDYQTREFLGITFNDRQYNTFNFQTKLSYNPTPGIRMILNYTGQWEYYNHYSRASWDYRYVPFNEAYTEEESHLMSFTFNHQIDQSTFYEVILSRYEKSYFTIPDNRYAPGRGMYPDDYLLYTDWEYYFDYDNNGRYDAPEPFINVAGDTVFLLPNGGPQYTQGDAMGGTFYEDLGLLYWNAADFWGSQGNYDTTYWDWDGDGIIDNADGEPFVDLDGDGQWDAGDFLLWDTNNNGRYDADRGFAVNVDNPEPYTDGDINLGEPFIDVNNNGIYDRGIDEFVMSSDPSLNMDKNRNARYDGPNSPWSPGVPYKDLNGNGLYDAPNGRYEFGEPYVDLNHNGKWDSADGFFDTGYDQWAVYHNRRSVINTLDFKLTKQLIPELENKSGFQIKYNELHMADLQYPYRPYDGDPDGGPYPERGIFRDFYSRFPYQGALFTQFKLEFGSLIARLGVRADFFIQSDNADQQVEEDIVSVALEDDRTKISPRIGISYPITEKAKVYFNYGHFYQLPEYQYMYRRATQASSAAGIVGNANLDFKQNIMYEFGVKYTLSNDYILDIAGFYNDLFGLVNSEVVNYGPYSRSEYENSDYARTRGMEIELKKQMGNYVGGDIAYTYQFAYGKSSSQSSNYFDNFYQNDIPIREFPLNWDATHQLKVSLQLGVSKTDEPELFGFRIPNWWNLSVIWAYQTGYPFTPSRSFPGLKVIQGETILRNSMRLPPYSNVDLRFIKNFTLAGLDYSFEVLINNLFDTQNVNGVYSNTGRPDTGTLVGRTIVEGTDNARNPDLYDPGRNIRVGLALNF